MLTPAQSTHPNLGAPVELGIAVQSILGTSDDAQYDPGEGVSIAP